MQEPNVLGIPVVVFVILLTTISLILPLVFVFSKLKKLKQKNPAFRLSDARFTETYCPKCKSLMKNGFVLVSRGIIFREENQNKFGQMVDISNALPYTYNLGIKPKENQAWHCDSCNYLLINHNEYYSG